MKKNGFSVIGKPLPRIDGPAKCAGDTRYADDMVLPRMLFSRLLRSPHPHALVHGVSARRALELPGVHAVITGADVPTKFGIMPSTQDEEALAVDKVRYVGDPVAAVAAVSEDVAEEALGLIDVDYQVLDPILSIEGALAAEDHRIHTWNRHANIQKAVSFEFGDVDAGFAEADEVFEGTYFFQGNTHLPMEQYCALASYTPDGKLTLWSSTQTPHYVHRALSRVLGLPMGHIRVVATPVGGGFGGKSDPFSHEIAVAKLAMITGRPVKITLSREESFYVHRGRHPVKMWMRTGVKRDGTLTGMWFRSFLDGGGYSSYGLATVYYTGALQTVTYELPAYKFEGVRVFTNKPPCGPKRGHGTPQPRFAMEVQLDEIAEKLGLDPVEMRLKQVVAPDSVTVNGLRVSTIGLRECIEKVAERSGWKDKHRALPDGHGIGFAASSYISGAGLPIYWNDMPHSGVQLRADRGGGVTVFCGSTDIGQGSDSILAFAVAEELGLQPEDVRVVTADTDLTPVDLGSYSSRVTVMTGNAAIQGLRQPQGTPAGGGLGGAGGATRRPGAGGRTGAQPQPAGPGFGLRRVRRAGGDPLRHLGRHRQLPAAAPPGRLQGRRRRPHAVVQLLGRGGGAPLRRRHRRDPHRQGVDRARLRPRFQPLVGGGAGGGQRVHGVGRGADGGADLPQVGGAQDPVHPRIQEPHHAGDAAHRDHPGGD